MKKLQKFLTAVLTITLLSVGVACGGNNSAASSSSDSSSGTSGDNAQTNTLASWIVACDGAEVSLCTDSNYVKEGSESSIKYVHGPKATDERMGAGIKFKEYAAQDIEENVVVYVYNASSYDYQLEAFCHQDAVAEIFQDYQEVAEYAIPAGEWTEVVVSVSAIANKCNNGVFDYFGFALRQVDNGGIGSQKWQSVELYFDGLEIFAPEE